MCCGDQTDQFSMYGMERNEYSMIEYEYSMYSRVQTDQFSMDGVTEY